MSVTEIQFGPVNGEMLTLLRPDQSPLQGFFGASVGDWGIDSNTGALYFDTNGATAGEQAVIGIDSTGVAFLEPAVQGEQDPMYAAIEMLTVMRNAREALTSPPVGKRLEQEAARELREAPGDPVTPDLETARLARELREPGVPAPDLTVERRGDSNQVERQRVRTPKALPMVVDDVARRLRQGRAITSTARLVRGDDDGRERREASGAVSSVVEVEQRASKAREARQKAVVLEDSTELEAVRRAMRDRRQKDANKESER